MKRAISYGRQSLDLGGVEASIGRQLKANASLIDSREWVLVAERKDVQSGYSGKKRPGWEEVLGYVRRGEVDVIVAWALDRITRSMKDLEELIDLCQENSVAVVTATGDIDLTTDVGRMIARILSAVARAEVERKAERQRLMWEDLAKKGGRTPGIRPFGYEADQMTVREEEASLIREATAMILAGISFGSIAKQWNEAGVKSSVSQHLKKEGANRGSKWDSTSVRLVLTNPRVSGRRSYNGEIVGEAQWPAIVSVDEQEALIALVQSRKPKQPTGGPKPKSLLSGILRCGKCGSVMRTTNARGVRQYKCREHGCTGGPIDRLDAFVETLVKEIILDRGMSLIEDLGDGVSDERHELGKEKLLLEERLNGLAAAFADGILTDEQMRTGTMTLRERLSAVESRLGAFTETRVLDGLAGESNLDAIWDELPVERKRAVVSWLLTLELGQHDRSDPKPAEMRVVWDWRHNAKSPTVQTEA